VRAYGDEARVTAVLADLASAPISEPLRATLRLLGKLTREHAITPADVREALTAGATKAQLRDAFAVCFAFNIIDRIADTVEFSVDTDFPQGAKMLLSKRGYRL
jgi:hypothetical protein